MVKHFCDFCEKEITTKLHTSSLPIAATFVGKDPCDLVDMDFELCKDCRSEVFKAVTKICPAEKTTAFCKTALDIKMGRRSK